VTNFALPGLVAAVILLTAAATLRRVVPRRMVVGDPVSIAVGTHRRFARGQPRAEDDDVAAWCEQVARGVRAGHSLGHAVIEAAVAAPAGAAAFQPVVRALRRGRGLADALDETAVDDPSSAPGLVVPVLSACVELGGPAALPLERVAATLHARSSERAERQTSSAQARLSARVLSIMPVGVLALLCLAEPAVRSTLATPPGIACVLAGIVFNLAGWCWMRRLIGGAR
jgi:tight adherence protein B